MNNLIYRSPIGILKIVFSDNGIVSVSFGDDRHSEEISHQNHKFLDQFDQYFKGDLKKFELPLDLSGTDFQINVWDELQKIPFGKTITYMELAKRLGDPKKIRAVAAANAANPIAIVVPCHRVIGSDGNLTGYAGGIWRKKWLLEHEQEGKQVKLFT